MTLHRFTAALLLVVVVGCASSDELHQRAGARNLATSIRTAESIDLFSLAPAEGIGAGTGPFHGYEVLGSVPVPPANRSSLADVVRHAVATSQPRLVACFYPRHGLRIKAGGSVTDVLICFECSTLYVEGEGPPERLNIENGPEGLLNSWLDASGVARAVSPSGD